MYSVTTTEQAQLIDNKESGSAEYFVGCVWDCTKNQNLKAKSPTPTARVPILYYESDTDATERGDIRQSFIWAGSSLRSNP